MGLSGRRRAKKETVVRPSIQQQADCSLADEVCSQQPLHKRTGNTLRRVIARSDREKMRAHMLEFEVSRGSSGDTDDLLPARPPTPDSADVGVEPNGNRYNRRMVHLVGNDFSSDVQYSLNKRSRWQFSQRLLADYETNESLKRQNVTLAESVNRSRGSEVKSLTTNMLYMAQALAELRDHRKQARDPAKRRLAQSDRFDFSEDVQWTRALRHMTKRVAPVGYVNANSIMHSCLPPSRNKRLDGLSPSAEKARQHLEEDFNARTKIVVGTCVPSEEAGATRFRQTERENLSAKRVGRSFPCSYPRLIERMQRQERCSRMELQLEKDGTAVLDECDVRQEAVEDAAAEVRSPRQLSLGDVLRSKTDISANRVRKLAKKTEKASKKLRSYSGEKVDLSGYDSVCETAELEGTQQSAPDPDTAADMRLSAAVEAELAIDRPVVQVPLETVATDHLIGLFGHVSGGEQALVIGSSVPRKLGVLLRSDLSESVVFEEVATLDTSRELATFAVHYSVSDTIPFAKRKTSAEEVAAQVDPFVFLRGLVEPPAAPLVAVEKSSRAATVATAVGGWKVADAMTESAARMTAIRALPMFRVNASDSDSGAVVIPSFECEICFLELWQTNEPPISRPCAQGSTMLSQCGHHFCNRCWVQHVASSIAQGRTKVTCPGYGCQSVVDAATLLWFCPCSLLSALTAGAYRNWLSERKRSRQRRPCSRARCGRVLEAPVGVNAVCGACSQGQCLSCGQEPHWPADCGTAARYLQKMRALGHVKLSLSDLEAVAEVNAKQCPTCRTVMEKGVGCNHMSCPCGEHFCWWCGRALRDHANKSICYQEPGKKSNYLIEQSFFAADSVLKPNSSQSRVYCEAVKVHLNRVQILRHLSMGKPQLAEFFAAHFYRSQTDRSLSDARRQAELHADELVTTVTQAAYLVEFAYAQADHHKVGRRISGLVRNVGGLAWHLAESIAAEVHEKRRFVYAGPKRNKETLERLQMLLVHLRVKYSLLHDLTASLPRNRSSVAKAV